MRHYLLTQGKHKQTNDVAIHNQIKYSPVNRSIGNDPGEKIPVLESIHCPLSSTDNGAGVALLRCPAVNGSSSRTSRRIALAAEPSPLKSFLSSAICSGVECNLNVDLLGWWRAAGWKAAPCEMIEMRSSKAEALNIMMALFF